MKLPKFDVKIIFYVIGDSIENHYKGFYNKESDFFITDELAFFKEEIKSWKYI